MMAEVQTAASSARVVLSLADGALTEESVTAAVKQVLELRGTVIPDLPLDRVLAASYWNDSDEHGTRTRAGGHCAEAADCPGGPDWMEYENPDHRAVTVAVSSVAPAATRGAWVSVPPDPGEAFTELVAGGLPTEQVTRELATEDYDFFMALGPAGPEGPRREGLHQRVYGWLAFPEQSWQAGELPRAQPPVLFSRRMTYLVVGGEGP